MAGPLSPEEWLKSQQPKGALSPDEWLASQKEGPTVLSDEDTSSDLMRGFRNVLPQIQETYGGAKVLAGKALDSKALMESGVQSMKEAEAKQVVRESDEFTKAWEKGIGAVLTDWLPYQIGAGAGNLLETLGFAGVGAAGGAGLPGAIAGTIGRATLKKEIRDKAAEILKNQGEEAAQKFIQKEAKKAVIGLGTTAGLATQAGFHGAGEVTSRAVQEAVQRGGSAEDIDMTKVVPAATVHAVADFIANKIMLGALKPVDSKKVGYLATEVAKRIAVTGVKEIPAEEIQTMAERYGAELSLTDAEALKEYVNTAAASVAMSVVPGGVGGVRTWANGVRDEQIQKKIEDDKNRESFSTDQADVKDPGGEIDPDLEKALKPVIDADGNPIAATATSVQAPNQNTATAPVDPNAAPATVSDPELDAMRLEYARRELEIKAGGPKPKIEAQTKKNAVLAEKIKAKEAELAQQATTAPAATPAVAPATTPTPPIDLTKFTAVPFTDPDDGTKVTVDFSKAYLGNDGIIYIPSTGDYNYGLDLFDPESIPQIAELEKVLQDRFAAELSQRQAASTTTPTSTFTEEELTGEAPPVTAATTPTPPVGAPEISTLPTTSTLDTIPSPPLGLAVTEAAAPTAGGTTTETAPAAAPVVETTTTETAPTVTGIKTKRAKAQTADDVSKLSFMEQPGYYGKRAPADIDEGILFAGREEGYDLYDTVDYEDGVKPEIKRLAVEENARIKAENARLKAEYEKRVDENKAKGMSAKEAKEKANPPVYRKPVSDERPFEFLTEDQMVELYLKHSGKRTIGRTESEAKIRQAHAAKRREFIDGLAPMQQLGIQTNTRTAFRQEVLSSEYRGESRSRRKMREAEKERRAQQMAQKLEQQLAEETKTDEQIAEEEKAFEEAAIKGAEAPTGRGAKKTEAETRRPLLRNIEAAVAETGSPIDVLAEIADDKTNDSVTRAVARAVAKTLKDLGLIDQLSAKIVFGEVEGRNDGKFDPATNTITIQGTDGKYNGYRKIDQVMLHEIMHYLTDHVIGNRQAYLTSIKDPAKRKSVESALNRLDNNYRLIKSKFGKKYNIGTMQEFIAEMYSNPSLQVDVASLPSDKPQTSLFRRVVENIAQALGFRDTKEAVDFKQIMDDIAEIISLPTAQVRGVSVSYSAAPQQPKKAEETKGRENDLYDETGYELPPEQKPKSLRFFKNLLMTVPGWRGIAQKFQNDRYPIKRWEDVLDLAGKIRYEGANLINNIYTQITLSTSRAKNQYNEKVKPLHEKLDKDMGRLARNADMSSEKALTFMHRLLEALHEPERRYVKYILTVPLSEDKNLNNNTISAADRRKQIVDILNTKGLSKNQALQLRTELDSLVNAKKPDGTLRYVDAYGFSPSLAKPTTPEQAAKLVDRDSPEYNVIGVSKEAIALRKQQFEDIKKNNPEQGQIIEDILRDLKDLNDITASLSKEANYWSKYVDNRVNFYNFQHYAPFKGKASFDKHSEIDEVLDFDATKMGRELQDVAFSFDGRTTVSDNPILQTISDAIRSTMRVGRKELTLAIKNSLEKSDKNPNGQGLLKGKVKETIAFKDRESDVLRKYKGETTIFHYNDDGSIDILFVEDLKLRDAIRRTYKDVNPFTEMANNVTSFLGKMHTRWNFNFAPLNFVRDAITNAWAIGADMGPQEALRFIGEISSKVVLKGALPKAMRVAALYEKGDFNKLKELAAKDPVYKDMLEFIEEGGMVSYIQGLSLKSNFQELQKEIGRSGVVKNITQLNKFLDIWVEMFELASRSSAYGIAKKNALAKKVSEKEAKVRAATYAKNLANFEQVGEWGKTMGAFFMFFRPAATGAVRAIESVAPAFRNLDDVVMELPETITGDQQALERFKSEYAFKQKNARIMAASLIGLGMVTYAMAAMMSSEDDLGRNNVVNDNPEQWTRFARFHIPDWLSGVEDFVVQIPWGFGLGAFAAAGAQLASVIGGKTSVSDALANVFLQISLDSFVPIPVSRMKPADNPLAFFIDSITPSAARPLVEFLINKNGLGQDIYNDANRRMGDAYLGGDKIPELWKDFSAFLANETLGAIDISPNSLYFLSNSYIDGVGRIFELGYGISDLTQGAKPFEPKTDIPLFGSFFGAKSSVDSREFAKYEKDIQERERRLNMFAKNPEMFGEYLAANPFDLPLVDLYNQQAGGPLKELRQQANYIRLSKALDPGDKKDLLKINKFQQDLIKRNLITIFEAYEDF